MSTKTMAKRRAAAGGEPGPEGGAARNKGRKNPEGFRTIGFRVSDEYAAWLERAAKHDRATIAAFLDRAAADYAGRLDGFGEAPPVRIP